LIEPFRVVRQASRSYPVYVGAGLLGSLGEVADSLETSGRIVAIVAKPVLSLYGNLIAAALPHVEVVEFDDGEEQKTLQNAEGLISELLARGVKRDTLAFVIGGGVTGDAAGFACSVVLRGIDFVHVPTTLLSQVDSSIGGKLGVNHRAGKNLIGSFAAPRAVVADISTLETLSRVELISGAFESLKSGVISDPVLFDTVATCRFESEELVEIVKRSIDVKANVVERDELETGDRKLLNYGHTIGHAIENALDYRGLTHGEAVGWGMIAANAIASRRGILPAAERARIDEAILAMAPRKMDSLESSDLVARTTHDKKFTATNRVMVLPRRIGECTIVSDVTVEELTRGCEEMLEVMGA
jgi:3-dehydroquinate synthase